MKIKKLDICGFKSFVDPTVLSFEQEITGIVGPNGCGKSNVVDAIRWVMGEQSAKHLRGRAMEDVIFNGSETRGPHGFAEVSITFDNCDGLAPVEYQDYAEIMVTRRLDRQGNSDYSINRTPVRLMDVTNLFLGTGVGKRAYSIIEQGRIGYIVSSKPEDRRHLIEEAAGVTKFKAKKRAAERKMDQTRQNLLRIGDIVTEIDRTLSSLKRQAQKAERYRRYRDEVRDLELLVASHKWLEFTAEQKLVGGRLDERSAVVDGARLALRIRDAEVEAERLSMHTVEGAVERAQNDAYELDNAVRLLESEINHHLERIAALREVEGRSERESTELLAQCRVLEQERDALSAALLDLERVEAEEQSALAVEATELDRRREAAREAEGAVVNARARVGDSDTRIARAEAVLASFERRRQESRVRLDKLQSDHDHVAADCERRRQEAVELRARLEGLKEGKATTAHRREQLEAELSSLRDEVRTSERALEELRETLTVRRSRLRSLEEIQARFEGVGAGVRAVMTGLCPNADQQAQAGIVGLLADLVDCPADLSRPLAAALGAALQHIVVTDAAAGARALSYLRAEGRGRATLVPRHPRRSLRVPAERPSGAGVVGCFADLLHYAAEDEAIIRHYLGHVWLVDELQSAQRLREELGGDFCYVTVDGELLEPDGRLTGGVDDDVGAHMLDVKREVRELHAIVATLGAEMTAAVSRHGTLREAVAGRQAALDGARSETHDAEIAIVTADKDLKRVESEGERLSARGAEIMAERDELEQTLMVATDEEEGARSEITSAAAARVEANEALLATDEIHLQRRGAVEEQSTRVTEVKIRAAQAKERAESDRGAMERLVRSIDELQSRRARLRDDIFDGAKQQGELIAHAVRSREELSHTVGRAMRAHETLGAARTHYDDAKSRLGEMEEGLRKIRDRIEHDSTEVNGLILREREISLALEHLLDSIADRHRLDLRRVIGDYHWRELPDASIKGRIDELLKLIERMGEINLTAIEEYKEQSDRFEYLSGQQKDLEDALLQLERAIRQMNRESRRLFKEAFDAVSERFKHVFPQMFGGGKAELRLTNPEDLLESGVDIIAQPPGKKLGSLELMSGGEKALTAVSLIFSLFQYRPSPFCLLDEVDAPLDEANIGRFSDAIRQMTEHSQFIVITHSKSTMEMADVLYGVTMETPGISKLVAVSLTGEGRKRLEGGQQAAAAVA